MLLKQLRGTFPNERFFGHDVLLICLLRTSRPCLPVEHFLWNLTQINIVKRFGSFFLSFLQTIQYVWVDHLPFLLQSQLDLGLSPTLLLILLRGLQKLHFILGLLLNKTKLPRGVVDALLFGLFMLVLVEVDFKFHFGNTEAEGACPVLHAIEFGLNLRVVLGTVECKLVVVDQILACGSKLEHFYFLWLGTHRTRYDPTFALRKCSFRSILSDCFPIPTWLLFVTFKTKANFLLFTFVCRGLHGL